MTYFEKIIFNKTELMQGETLIIKFVPELENQHLCVNPFINPYLKKVNIKRANIGDEVKAGYNDLLVPLPDGTYQLVLQTYDWEIGEYYIQVYEKPAYSEKIISQRINILPKDEIIEADFIAAMEEVNILGLFDGNAQEEISVVTPGQHLVIGFNPNLPNIIRYKNNIKLRFTNEELGTITLMEIRPNRNYAKDVQVDVTNGEIMLQHFNFIGHQPFINVSGYCELEIDLTLLTVEGNEYNSQKTVLFQVVDDFNYSPIIVNSGRSLKKFEVGLFYYGNMKTNEELEELKENIKQTFYQSTKNYFNMDLLLVGNSSLPDDENHPYEIWWQSLPHNLNGSDLLPLEPDDQFYLEKIRYLWYYFGGFNPNDFEDYNSIPINEKGFLLVNNEVKEIYSLGSNGEKFLIILTDAGFPGIAGKVPNENVIILKTFGMSQIEYIDDSNIINYGNPKYWAMNSNEHIINEAMHECGHALWTPVRFPDVEEVMYPYNKLTLPIFITDSSRARFHNLDFMSYTRNRETLENMKYADEWIHLALKYFKSPQIVNTTPVKNEILVPRNTSITVHFNVPMNQKYTNISFSISPRIPGIFEWSEDSKVMHYKTSRVLLSSNTTYQVIINLGARDINGNSLIAPYSWIFKTGKGKKSKITLKKKK